MKYIIIKIFLIINFFYTNILYSKKIEIVAKVNNQVITNLDLENRLNLALELSNIPNNKDIRNQLKKQILDILIVESLKIQEAQRLGVFITSDEVNNEIFRIERKLEMQPNTLIKSYKEKNISETTIYEQLRSQLLWNKLISMTISSNVKVTDKQKDEAFNNFIKTSGEAEYNISEIFISFSSNNTYSAKEKANSIYSRINLSNFTSTVEQFSDGAINIDNWTRESMLNDSLKKALKTLKIGNISQPIESSVGYHIILLNGKRDSKKIIENEKLYNLSQIFFKFIKNNDEEMNSFNKLLTDLRNTVNGCNELTNSINNLKASSGGNLGLLSENSLDSKFVAIIKDGLEVGVLSKKIVTEDGLHALMLCQPVVEVNYDDIKKNLENKIRIDKINSSINLLLDRIRQKALIEVKPI